MNPHHLSEPRSHWNKPNSTLTTISRRVHVSSKLVLSAVVLVAMSSGSTGLAAGIDYRIQLTKGIIYEQQTVTDSQVTERKRFEVLEVDSENNAEIQMTIIEMDDGSDISRYLIGKSCTFRMSPKGEVSDIEGNENAIQQALSMAQEEQPDAESETIRIHLEGRFSDDVLKDDLRDHLPEGPVSVGSKWTGEIDMNGTATTIEYTLQKIEDDSLEVSGFANIEKFAEATLNAQLENSRAEAIGSSARTPSTANVSLSAGKCWIKGTVKIDRKTGLTLEAHADLHMEGDILSNAHGESKQAESLERFGPFHSTNRVTTSIISQTGVTDLGGSHD